MELLSVEPVNHGVYGAEAFAFSSGIEQCHHQHMEFRVFGGSVEEGTRDAVQMCIRDSNGSR